MRPQHDARFGRADKNTTVLAEQTLQYLDSLHLYIAIKIDQHVAAKNEIVGCFVRQKIIGQHIAMAKTDLAAHVFRQGRCRIVVGGKMLVAVFQLLATERVAAINASLSY